MVSINNQIITMNRGDSFYIPLVINAGTKSLPDYYTITDKDTIYFAVEEPNQPFEFAIIRKTFGVEDLVDGNVLIKLDSKDTECLLPGQYYYEIKIRHIEDEDKEYIDTIVPRRKFNIID